MNSNKEKSNTDKIVIPILIFIIGFLAGMLTSYVVNRYEPIGGPRPLNYEKGILVAESEPLHKLKSPEKSIELTEEQKEMLGKFTETNKNHLGNRACTGRPICTYIKPHTFKLGARFY